MNKISRSDPDTEATGSPAIHSFLNRLEDSEIRRELNRLRQCAYEAVYEAQEDPLVYMGMIAEHHGINIAEVRNPCSDINRIHCAEWVLNEKLGFNIQGDRHFWNTVINQLQSLNYQPTNQPLQNDLILYGFWDPAGIRAKHLGLFQNTGQILSKFEMGHIFEHDHSIVPSVYGDSFLYLTKS